MPAAPESAPLFSEQGAGALRLIGYLALAAMLMASDYRSGSLRMLRHQASNLAAPVYQLATAPVRLGRELRDASVERRTLVAENARLREQLLRAQAGLSQIDSLDEENRRLRELLDARERLGLSAQLVELVEVDLGPYRHRLLLDGGARAGIEVNQAVMDAHGLVGQISRSDPAQAEVILITDPGHAVPVRVVRNGLRAVAYGTGALDRVELPHIPFSADIVSGDVLVTSGVGGHFPAGIPVAVVSDVHGDDSATFAIAEASPAAGLTRSNQVLVLRAQPESNTTAAMAPAGDATQAPPR